MQKSIRGWSLSALAFVIPALLAACGDDPQPVAPGIQPEIINSVDNFQFQVTAVDNYSGALTYYWSNTGQAATVNQSCAVSGGTVTLTLLDDAGQSVYTKDLSQNGSYPSATGTSGSWRVRVVMSGVTGDLNFRVDKATP
jgi:hypothetical protein